MRSSRWNILLRVVCLSALLAGATANAAITGKVVGRVTDDSGSPLPGAAVVIEGRQLGATTDPDGRYFILQVPPGTYSIEAHLVGFQAVRQRGVIVNVDRTTQLSFRLSESAIEVDAITVTADRPVVEQDVTSSQIFVTAKTAQELPVSQLIDAIAIQPGIDLKNRQLSVRGSTPDEISFQVDGFEQTNPLENRSYSSMNQAMVQEVQVITGAFTAEYSSRAAVINVVTKDPGAIPTLSGDFRAIPMRQQHFGPDAFGNDELDRLVYSNDGSISSNGRVFNVVNGVPTDMVNSNLPVYLARMDTSAQIPEASSIFDGWDAIATKANAGTYPNSNPILAAHKGFWTADGLREVWDWQHRGWDYHDQGDYYLDAALTMPLYGIPRTGLVLGFKDTRAVLPYPAAVQAYADRVFEGTFKSSLIPAIKIEARGRYEVVKSTAQGSDGAGGDGGSRDIEIFASGNESSIVSGYVGGGGSTLLGFTQSQGAYGFGQAGQMNKYNKYANVPYQETITGGGVRLTHTLSPSTYYTVSYEFLQGETEAHPARGRRTVTAYNADGTPKTGDIAGQRYWDPVRHGPSAISSAPNTVIPIADSTDWGGPRDTGVPWIAYKFDMNGRTVYVDETPDGALGGENLGQDIATRYLLQGGANLSDYSEWRTDRIRADVYSQINANHAIKAGADYSFENLIKDMRRMNRVNNANGHFDRYEASPWQAGFYVQDKMEYEGLVANFGVRLDAFDANGVILFPELEFPWMFKRGYLYGELVNVYDVDMSKYPVSTTRNRDYADSSRDMDPGWALNKLIMETVPHAYSETAWKLAPRLGISHPVGTSTKFFFNFGWMYSTPKSGFRYGYSSENSQIGASDAEVRGAPNPNLPPPRTVVYEVGFEQSIRNTYVVRAKGYSKDDEDEPGTVQMTGRSASMATGGGGIGTAVSFRTFGANNYQSVRGLELTFEKARGRFVTGSVNFDIRVLTVGQNGFGTRFEDVRALDVPNTIVINQPQFQPQGNATLVFSTPSDYGMAIGNWSLSLLQSYSRGSLTVYYYDNDQNRPVKLRWVDTWRTNARLQKSLFLGSRSLTAYVDVRNLFNRKTFNPGAIYNAATTYYQGMIIEETATGELRAKHKLGDLSFDYQGENVEDFIKRALVRDNDWLLFQNPREIQFGVRIDL